MKLKYYMRGLGIGIILTTLILTITKTDHDITDEEIIRRARLLGMVTEEEFNSDLEQVLNGEKSEDTKEEPSPTLSPTKAPETTTTPTVEPTIEPTIEPTPEVTPEITLAPSAIPEPTLPSSEISFTIEKGMTSGEVAKLLVKVGLIEDAIAFNRYIQYQGKEGIIRIGSYTINKGASYDDIIKEITKK